MCMESLQLCCLGVGIPLFPWNTGATAQTPVPTPTSLISPNYDYESHQAIPAYFVAEHNGEDRYHTYPYASQFWLY